MAYETTLLKDIINHFMMVYVGEDKIISKLKRLDAVFHAQRALQELSYDTLKSTKSREITVPSSLQMDLPEDYVNYTKISWVDSAGIKHLLYPTSKTSNPTKYQVDSNGEYLLDTDGNYIPSGELIKNGNFANGSQDWILNATDYATGGSLNTFTSKTFSSGGNQGDPEEGWFYGWNGNALGGYEIEEFNGIIQQNIPIISGEEYTITYTLSGYTSGTWRCFISDENGDDTGMTDATANGTYSETITAGANENSYAPQSIYFRNDSATPGNVVVDDFSIVRVGDEETSTTWSNYKSGTPSENNNDDYEDDTYWPAEGSRFGLDPQHAQANGSFYMDNQTGKIHFSSNISGKIIVLDYLSDGLGSFDEMVIHKFAEEAIYKWILHAVLSTRANIPEQLVRRYKKERFAAIRQTKLRLSNIKLEEITQILRGKSKQIKH
tara:strand:+ start:792 stop:2102 length:1311 start_codon:yes stop_codon:yes gene_type:complete